MTLPTCGKLVLTSKQNNLRINPEELTLFWITLALNCLPIWSWLTVRIALLWSFMMIANWEQLTSNFGRCFYLRRDGFKLSSYSSSLSSQANPLVSLLISQPDGATMVSLTGVKWKSPLSRFLDHSLVDLCNKLTRFLGWIWFMTITTNIGLLVM